MNKIINQNKKLSFRENASENIICEMVAILSRGRWVLTVQLWVPIVSPLHVLCHDDVITWKDFPRYWPFVRRIHRSPVNSPHKGQWRGALMFSWICARINGWINIRVAGDLRGHQAHCDVIVMITIPMDPNFDNLSTTTNTVRQVLWFFLIFLTPYSLGFFLRYAHMYWSDIYTVTKPFQFALFSPRNSFLIDLNHCIYISKRRVKLLAFFVFAKKICKLTCTNQQQTLLKT